MPKKGEKEVKMAQDTAARIDEAKARAAKAAEKAKASGQANAGPSKTNKKK